ncbi:MAG: inositol monophosphatase family protein [Gemmatimonadales bacterium]
MLSPLDLLDLAARAADRAAGYIRSVDAPKDPTRWGSKGARDFVTDVDRTAESLITEMLQRDGPPGTIMGEEHSPDVTADGLLWIVDPLDGTTNFLHGYPMYAISIAAAVDGVLQAGVVLDVTRNIAYRAALGSGATANGQSLAVSGLATPAHALIGTGFPFKQLDRLATYQGQFARVLEHSSGVRRTGSAALDLAAVAAGLFDGFWELILAPWDIAAGIVLVQEAGGRITDDNGRPLGIGHSSVVAGNPSIHAWLLEQVNPAPNPMAVIADREGAS